jgi:hypothetical protein
MCLVCSGLCTVVHKSCPADPSVNVIIQTVFSILFSSLDVRKTRPIPYGPLEGRLLPTLRPGKMFAPHGPASFTPEQEHILSAFIRDECNRGNHATQKEFINLIENKFQETIASGSVVSCVSRHSQEARCTMVSPQELPTPRCCLQRVIHLLQE